jgi:UDP-N-acetylmuramyl pentapeptide phosphotransferase/UDP-N-acetylglucosamine-1-phosphate transferase
MSGLEAHRGVLIAVVVVVAASICDGLIKLLLPLLRRYALARPNARSSHVEPTPQGAGAAVIVTSLSVATVAAILGDVSVPTTIFASVLFIGLVGLVDDVRPMPVMPRLLLQTAAVGAVVFVTPADLRIAPACPIGIERMLLLIAGLWFVNLVNFMDGLDLMTFAEVVPITGAMVLLGLIGQFPESATIAAAALGGAMLGFAPFNRPVAKVFLGDVGSLPIGLLLGWCLMQLAWHQQLTAALLLPLYYLTDTTVTLCRRIAKGERFWAAHRSHFYQRAIDNGFTVSRVIAEVFALNVALAVLAMISIHAGSAIADIPTGITGAAAVTRQIYRFSRKRTPAG